MLRSNTLRHRAAAHLLRGEQQVTADYLCGVAEDIQEALGVGGPEGAAVLSILERRLLRGERAVATTDRSES